MSVPAPQTAARRPTSVSAFTVTRVLHEMSIGLSAMPAMISRKPRTPRRNAIRHTAGAPEAIAA
ncbi:hypothetical protein GCM10009605_15900 [Nocardiopsis composta]